MSEDRHYKPKNIKKGKLMKSGRCPKCGVKVYKMYGQEGWKAYKELKG